MKEQYPFQWPRDGIYVRGMLHQVMNYRYHWHEDDYELNLVLRGKIQCHTDNQDFILEENDCLLIHPGEGHCSLALEPFTLCVVVHISAKIFRSLAKTNQFLRFDNCWSSAENRSSMPFFLIRLAGAHLVTAMQETSTGAAMAVRGNTELLVSTLLRYFPYTIEERSYSMDDRNTEAIQSITEYIEAHYREKITLEDMARFTQYNRTYFSTYFKQNLGMNFYEYLTKLRFRNASIELVTTRKTLTNVAIDNGFPELKLFNKRFRETFGISPAEYRAIMENREVAQNLMTRRLIPLDNPLAAEKLALWMGASTVS